MRRKTVCVRFTKTVTLSQDRIVTVPAQVSEDELFQLAEALFNEDACEGEDSDIEYEVEDTGHVEDAETWVLNERGRWEPGSIPDVVVISTDYFEDADETEAEAALARLIARVNGRYPLARILQISEHQRASHLATLPPDVVVIDVPGEWYEDCW